MDRISQILREEIDKFILREAIDFSPLATASKNLNDAVVELGKYDSSTSQKDIQDYLYKLEYYAIQVVFAANRCVKANSINEGLFSSLADYGFEVPREFTFWNDAKNSYYNTKNFIGLMSGNGKGNGGSFNGGGTNVDPNKVKSEKLQVLLGKLNYFVQEKKKLETKYSFRMEQATQAPLKVLTCIGEVNTAYERIKAQGTTP